MELEKDGLVEGGYDENRRLSEAGYCDFPGSTQYPQDGQLEMESHQNTSMTTR